MAKKSSSVKCLWFIEPLNAFTNNIIAGYQLGEENEMNFGNGLRVWRVPSFAFVVNLRKASRGPGGLPLYFNVYSQDGLDSSARLHKLGFYCVNSNALRQSA